jgi:energy-coupling factor transporter transmembrane protein EcfT
MEALLHVANFVVSLVVITVLFAMIYKILPNVEIEWRDVWVGAAITALLFAIGKFVIGLYIGKSDVASSFGSAGPFVVIMLWIFYSTQIFLLGAEFTALQAGHNSPEKARARLEAFEAAGATPKPTPQRSPAPVAHEVTHVTAARETTAFAQTRGFLRDPYHKAAITAVAGLIGGIALALLMPDRSRSGPSAARREAAKLAADMRNTLEKWRALASDAWRRHVR